jgi:membrane protein implicated in regulation of membrane protease activity
VGGLVAIGGAWYVHHWHEAHRKADEGRSNFLDRGQPVVMEGWANEAAGLARVKYRGASWDARVAGGAARPTPGTTLYIEAQEGADAGGRGRAGQQIDEQQGESQCSGKPQ